jgi:integrase
MRRRRKASGIADLTFRQLRTTFGTLFEGDAKDLQATLGHHFAAFTLDTYRKPLQARAAAATEDLDARLSNVIPIRRAHEVLRIVRNCSQKSAYPNANKASAA